MSVNFPRIAARLLAQADALLPQWLPGGRWRGREWVCADLNGGKGESCSTNRETGMGSDFATGVVWGDLIALYAAIHGLSQPEAAFELYPDEIDSSPQPARHNGNGSHRQPTIQQPISPEIHDVAGAPITTPLPAHPKSTGRWVYHDAAGAPVLVVCRIPDPDEPTKKSFVQYTYRGGKWTPKGYGERRPLYRLPQLLASPAARVLVVEGEKCAEAAASVLNPSWCATTWAAGVNSVKKSDWTPLNGREVVIWPDADEPGRKAAAAIAAILLALNCQVAIVTVDGKPEGWDIADAVPAEVPAFLAAAVPIAPVQRGSRARPIAPNGAAVITPSGALLNGGSAFVSWQSLGLDCNGNGQPFATLGNANLVLTRHPDLSHKIWMDTFRGRIYHTLRGDPAPWMDADALRLTAWFQQTLALSKIGLETVYHAVELCAANNPRNSVTEWLESLEWDRTERLSSWLADYLGVDKTAFTMAVARNWLISMVARACRPGCQADHMPVLEGNSGAGKSSALAILGGEWYRAAPQAFGSKEFLEAIQGAWLIEIPDMVGFGRREHTQIISAITTRSDVYRASYGRNAEEHPRTAIFAATSETDEYLQDSRGKRRYWPVRCNGIELEGLRAAKAQLFAEALHAFRSRSQWHEVPLDEAKEEQSAREQTDVWAIYVEQFGAVRESVLISDVLSYGLDIPPGKQTQSDKNRVSKCLQNLGYSKKKERDGSVTVWRYRRLK